MIGCADVGDPDDYFTSFFSHDLSGGDQYKPFYYTSLLTFYDDWDGDLPVGYEDDKVIQEWKQYCGAKASPKDVADFVYGASEKDVVSLFQHVANNKPLQVVDSIRNNPLTQCFISQKATAALSYLAFAKKTERISITSTPWEEVPPRDSLLLNKYITEANQIFTNTKDVFLKNKYAYQRCKVAFYNNRFADCIKWYDEYFTPSNTAAVNNLALSYKAGSYYHLGKKKEATYYFAKAFEATENNKRQNYLSFLWSRDLAQQIVYVAQGQNNEEKALLLAMYILHGDDYALESLQKVYSWHPGSSLLPLLTVREINKIEDHYLTPMLSSEKGGKPYYFNWNVEKTEGQPEKQTLVNMIPFLEQIYKEGKAPNRELYITGAAYLSFINKDFAKAKAFLKDANKIANSDRIKDQLQLINLLIAVNEKETIDTKTEAAILPSLNWLVERSKKDKTYKLFLRNFFSQILAQKYEQQHDAHKAALAYGIADLSFIKNGEDDVYSSVNGLDYVRNEMTTDQLLKLHQFFTSSPSSYDQFLGKYTSFGKDAVIDVIGTSYLRDQDFVKATEWLKQVSKPEPLSISNYNYATDKETIVNVNPLHDYLNDWQRYDKPVAKPYTKLSLAQKMIELQQKADTALNTETKARTYYQLANAYYNMSYYGNSWQAVMYYRSSSDWNEGKYEMPWKKEYYGVYKAKEYYQKAYTLSQDKEFKAAAYFLMAKCVQRQVPMPPYNYDNYEQYEKDMLTFEKKFKNNALFPQFVKEFSTTKFYQYAYNRCSYLSDFVSKSGTRR
ncbi:hypothetical protein [Flavisolibacter tropicus]|uniref:Tetratricopeptide repeat protein n=1 Tax=Flavisolibacter tropicus TaxID=1492898 RepID=A0A172U007_9BACT|nr:hypothetical protein [Flavisolibacter tropicus]ANE52586.1 hypothetical protein SY85_20975 [Flavisolibacter tropicus]